MLAIEVLKILSESNMKDLKKINQEKSLHLIKLTSFSLKDEISVKIWNTFSSMCKILFAFFFI